jgi:hypothetical protein
MKKRLHGALLTGSFFALLCCVPDATRAVAVAGQNSDEDSIHQDFPCGDQARTYKELMASFAKGRVPSPSEVSGTWVLVGLWLYKDSKPGLNCKGLNRGKTLEWVIQAKRYSIEFDSVGDGPQTTSFELDRNGSLTFSVGFGGENSPVFRCRMTERRNLVCSGSTYYQGAEFKKMAVEEARIPRDTYP